VVADVAKLSAGREDYYLRELATDHQQYLSGHGESPGRWYGAGTASLGLEGEASPAGFRQMFEGRHPDTGELLGRPHGRNAVPAFDVVLRPTKSVSILYGLATRRPAGRCWPPITPAWPQRPPTWTSTWGPAAATAATSTWTEEGCWPSGSTTGPAGRVIRCCTPIWWWPTVSRARMGGGRPWTAGTCTGTA
jgi:TrwC relaxase